MSFVGWTQPSTPYGGGYLMPETKYGYEADVMLQEDFRETGSEPPKSKH